MKITKKDLQKDIKILLTIIRFYTDGKVNDVKGSVKLLEDIRKDDGPTKEKNN